MPRKTFGHPGFLFAKSGHPSYGPLLHPELPTVSPQGPEAGIREGVISDLQALS